MSEAGRVGERWTDSDHDVLIDGLTNGDSLEAVSTQLGRGPRAVNKHLARMLGDEAAGLTPTEVTSTARLRLRDPAFPWRERVGAAAASSPQAPPRTGALWERGDYESIIAGLTAGEDLVTIADRLQRKPAAVHQRVARMLGDTGGLGRAELLEQARTHLVDPSFPWEENVRAKTPGRPWWLDALPALRQAWADGQPSLTDLERTFNIPEHKLAERLVREGSATSLREVADRLGYSPEGTLAVHLTDERPLPTVVIVTVIDGAGTLLHTAAYTSVNAAEAAVRAYQDSGLATSQNNPARYWWLTRCTPDSAAGTSHLRAGEYPL